MGLRDETGHEKVDKRCDKKIKVVDASTPLPEAPLAKKYLSFRRGSMSVPLRTRDAKRLVVYLVFAGFTLIFPKNANMRAVMGRSPKYPSKPL
jgi:hypothetical protein